MSNHDVSIDGDSQDGEQGDSQKSVAQQGKQLAQQPTVSPGSVVEGGCGEGKVETAEHEIGYGQVHDEYCCCIPNLKPTKRCA